MHDWLALIGAWTVLTYTLRTLDWVVRWHIRWFATRRAIRNVTRDSHRWDAWARYHAGGRL